MIIVTTHKRLASEWKKGKPTIHSIPTYDEEKKNISSLLRVIFYRIAFDEGHKMGQSNLSDSLFMASALFAKNRWLLTGTPTPSDPSHTLSYLSHQFRFLRHPIFYGTKTSNSELWRRLFSQTFSDGSNPHAYSSVTLLVRLLTESMIRHTKHSIIGIPKPIYRLTKLVLGSEEKKTYNSLVALIRVNLVLTGLDYKTPGSQHLDSFLNPLNKKALSEVITNLRIATSGSGSAPLILPKQDIIMNKIECFLENHPHQCEILIKLKLLIDRTLEQKHSKCDRCHKLHALLIITPCCHLVIITFEL